PAVIPVIAEPLGDADELWRFFTERLVSAPVMAADAAHPLLARVGPDKSGALRLLLTGRRRRRLAITGRHPCVFGERSGERVRVARIVVGHADLLPLSHPRAAGKDAVDPAREQFRAGSGERRRSFRQRGGGRGAVQFVTHYAAELSHACSQIVNRRGTHVG